MDEILLDLANKARFEQDDNLADFYITQLEIQAYNERTEKEIAYAKNL
jgi:hypothetical protein